MQILMTRNNVIVKIARNFTKFPFQIFRPLELLILSLISPKRNSPVIIILSLPRSGSTLTYQAIAHRFKVYFLSNLSHLLYKLPYIGFLLTRNRSYNYNSDFRSSNGFVKGLFGPAEGLHFWRYWFGCTLSQSDMSNNFLSSSKTNGLVKYFSSISSSNRPILTAYLGHIFCFDRLKVTFPNAIFVRVNRDPVDVINSILKQTPEGESGLFSLRPAGFKPSVYKDKLSKVAAQVYFLRKELYKIDDTNIFEIEYDKLCDEPNLVMNKLREYCAERNTYLELNNHLPVKFNKSVVSDVTMRKTIQQTFDSIKDEND